MPRIAVLTIDDADGAALRAHLASGAAPEVTLHAEIDTGWRRTPILVAEMHAPDATEATPFVLLSGHHDTWYEGVMDNGSANVTMMEVARLCALSRARWKRSLRLCFWSGHSHGRYSGSAWYADAHWHELEQSCAVHVNVDSTGGIGATDLSHAPASSALASLADDALRRVAGIGFAGARMGRNSDQSFWGIGVPSIFGVLSCQPPGNVRLRHGLGWWWHTPDDLLDKIDPALLERDTAIYLHVMERLLLDATLPIEISRQLDNGT